MQTFEAIFTRRSIRKYKGIRVSEEAIMKILTAGMYAPSAVNKQPWHFIVFQENKLKKDIVKAHPHAAMLPNADTGILVCWDNNLAHDGIYGPIDCAAATQNMLLAAHDLKLGAVWIGVYPREERAKSIHKLFNLPTYISPFAIISIGHPGEEKQQPERFNKERIHFEKW